MLVIDSDHRFSEVLSLVRGDVYELGERPSDRTDSDRIAALLAESMPGSDVATIVVDSLTSIITPLVVQAMQDKEHGRLKNLAAGFREKALAMRQLQDSISRWGSDVLWIYHLDDARDEKGEALTRPSVSKTERARLIRSLNLQLEIVQEAGRRGVRVVWARQGRQGMTLWDEAGRWAGMPEAIEQAVYGGLSQAEQEQISRAVPDVFASPELAISWGYEQGAFNALQHSRNAYERLRKEAQPKSAREMAALWTAAVQAKLQEKAAQGQAGASQRLL